MEPTDLLTSAQEHLEQNSFSEAVTSFREYALASIPNERTLANLAVAEDQDRLEFLRTLVATHQDDATCRLAEISELTRLGHAAIAQKKCSDALQSSPEEKEEFFLKLARVRSACASEQFDSWYSDFRDVWNSSFRAAERFRPRLIRELVAINSTEAVESLQQLQAEGWVSNRLRRLVEAKISELHLLAQDDDS